MIKKLLPYLSLFSSLSTLLCCALPALFVSLGMGATLVSVLGTFPQLIWLSEHKGIVFGTAGALLLASFLMKKLSRESSCPSDPALARACTSAKRISSTIFALSVIVYSVGVFFAFVAPIVF